MTMTKTALIYIFISLASANASVNKTSKSIDPKADKILHQMTDYIAGLKTFRANSSTIDEIVTKKGQKIQVATDSKFLVERPARLKSEQVSTGAEGTGNLVFTDDGQEMTLYCKANNTYATVKSPPTLDAAIDEIRVKHNIDAPGADLLFSKPYDVLTEQVTNGEYIGRETLNGVVTHHLAFQGEEVDWQIWIQDGSQPLPLRYVITTKTVKNHPQFTVSFSHWEPMAKINADEFKFVPSTGAKRVKEFPTSCL